MKELTPAEQLANCRLALEKWQTVPEEKARLDLWQCGTYACFGGYVTSWPEFRAKGVTAHGSGMPMMFGKDGFDVAQILFGTGSLFYARGEGEEGSDHEVVVERLEAQIKKLSEVVNHEQ